MNTPRLVLHFTMVLAFWVSAVDLVSAQLATYTDFNGWLEMKLPGCPNLPNAGNVLSYTGSNSGCESLILLPDSPGITPLTYESEGEQNQALLVTGHTLDKLATALSYPYLVGERYSGLSLPVLPVTDDNQNGKVVSPVLEVYGSRESLLLIYEKRETPSWYWLRVNATQEKDHSISKRRYFLDDGEAVYITSCGFDIAASYNSLQLSGGEFDISVAAMNGTLGVQSWHEEPQDMDGGGEGGGASNWWGDTQGVKGLTYAEITQSQPRRNMKGDDDDPERKREPPKILKGCEASPIPPDYGSMTIGQLIKAFKGLGRYDDADGRLIITTAVEKCEESRKPQNRGHMIGSIRMRELLHLQKSRNYRIGLTLMNRLDDLSRM
ncbi:MAG: hypothetical protein ACR2PT_05590 [Endozoicomonas sp.]